MQILPEQRKSIHQQFSSSQNRQLKHSSKISQELEQKTLPLLQR
ncbi:hypothetical protein S1OALGB6SA_1975 [Olavius algarvensis spirochete endosymbiont]|nr:hypothetical protein S1OALGB6SA_1975 [Olavius algarvensis spirochete endosymbiont]